MRYFKYVLSDGTNDACFVVDTEVFVYCNNGEVDHINKSAQEFLRISKRYPRDYVEISKSEAAILIATFRLSS